MAKLAMVKEVKIGLAVISGLLLVLGAVVYKQVTRKTVVPIAAASENDASGAKPNDGQNSARTADRIPEEDGPAGGRNHKWLRTSASEPAADDVRDAGAPPRPSFMPTVNDEAPDNKVPAVDDRYGARQHGREAEPDVRGNNDAAVPRDPFAGRREEKTESAESPLKAAEDPKLSPSPDSQKADPRDEPLRSSIVTGPGPEAVAAADERPGAAVVRDDGARGREIPDGGGPGATDARSPNRDIQSERPVAQPPSRLLDDVSDQRAFPPLTGRLPAARLASAVENGVYTVQPNDNYWVISEKVYGTGGYFKAIHQQNRGKFPHADKLQVGDKLTVPPVAQLEQDYPDLCPKRRHVRPPHSATITASARQRVGGKIYVVQEGDTLFDIARYQLGKATRWAEIYDLNRESLGDDFDFLQPGTELTLPGSPQEDDILTRRRGPTDRR